MKQIVDKLNKIAKKIDESVEIPQTDLIIDSLDAITKAYGGTPNDSNLIVDKLEDIYNNIGSAPSGNIAITANTAEGETLDVSQYATATVNVSGGGGDLQLFTINITATGNSPGYISGTFIDENGFVINHVNMTAGSYELKSYILKVENLMVPGTYSYGVPDISKDYIQSYTEHNCLLQLNDSVYSIRITDETQPASVDLVMNFGGLG